MNPFKGCMMQLEDVTWRQPEGTFWILDVFSDDVGCEPELMNTVFSFATCLFVRISNQFLWLRNTVAVGGHACQLSPSRFGV